MLHNPFYWALSRRSAGIRLSVCASDETICVHCWAHSNSFDPNEIVFRFWIYGSLHIFIAEISTMIVHILRTNQICCFRRTLFSILLRRGTHPVSKKHMYFAIVNIVVLTHGDMVHIARRPTETAHDYVKTSNTNWWQFYCAWFMTTICLHSNVFVVVPKTSHALWSGN